MFEMFESKDQKVVRVTDTAWGKGYEITTRPVGENHSRVEIRFPERGSKYVSNLLFTNEEVGEPIAWLQEYTRTHNIYPLLDKFKKVVDNTPFDQ